MSFSVGSEIMYAKWFWKICIFFLRSNLCRLVTKLNLFFFIFIFFLFLYTIFWMSSVMKLKETAFWVLRIWSCNEGTGTPAAYFREPRFRCRLFWGFCNFCQSLQTSIRMVYQIRPHILPFTSLPLSPLATDHSATCATKTWILTAPSSEVWRTFMRGW